MIDDDYKQKNSKQARKKEMNLCVCVWFRQQGTLLLVPSISLAILPSLEFVPFVR